MPDRCLLYYITDRTAFPGDESTRRRRLLEKIAEAARCGVDYIQLREKDLPTRELEQLAREALRIIHDNCPPKTENRESRNENSKLATDHWPLTTALLINSRTDVALAAGADGVHLRSGDVSPAEVRTAWKCGAGAPSTSSGQTREISPYEPILSVSCHSPAEVARAAASGAHFGVFAPVFEKKDVTDTRPAGLIQLQEACRAKIPVLALGGVTLENAKSCLVAGAAGIAAIRLFQENDIAKVVLKLEAMGS
jgi:thiamine-phosphate pyrophosphorylase